jgi:hypothetical protein
MRRPALALGVLVLGFAACTDPGEYDNPRTFRLVAADGGRTFSDRGSLECIAWNEPCPDGVRTGEGECRCVRRTLRSAKGLSFTFDDEAPLGTPLRTDEGALAISAPDGSPAEGQLTLTKRVRIGGSTYFTDYAGTFVARGRSLDLTRGVFFSLDDE